MLTASTILPTIADEPIQPASFAPLATNLETLVRRFYPKAKIRKTDASISFEYKTKPYDIPSTNTIEPGPDWGGVLGNVSMKSGHLGEQDAVEKKLNQYSYYVVMEMHQNCPSGDCHVDARLAYPFDVQPDFLSEFKTLIRKADVVKPMP